jgi:hypothetical protein
MIRGWRAIAGLSNMPPGYAKLWGDNTGRTDSFPAVLWELKMQNDVTQAGIEQEVWTWLTNPDCEMTTYLELTRNG